MSNWLKFYRKGKNSLLIVQGVPIINIEFRNNKVKKLCTNYIAAQKSLNIEVAEALHALINFIQNAKDIHDIAAIKHYNFHPLIGNRKGQYALDLGRKLGWRLIITLRDDCGRRIDSSDERLYQDSALVVLVWEVSKHYE